MSSWGIVDNKSMASGIVFIAGGAGIYVLYSIKAAVSGAGRRSHIKNKISVGA